MIDTQQPTVFTTRLVFIPIKFQNFIKDNRYNVSKHLEKYYLYPDQQVFNSCLSLTETGKLIISDQRPVHPLGLKRDLNVSGNHLSNKLWATLILYRYKQWLKLQLKRQQRYNANDCNKYLAASTETDTFSDALFTPQAYIDWIINQLDSSDLKVNLMYINQDINYFAQHLILHPKYDELITNKVAINTIYSIINYQPKPLMELQVPSMELNFLTRVIKEKQTLITK